MATSHSSLLRVSPLLAALVLTAAGCGSSSDSNTSSTGAQQTATATVTQSQGGARTDTTNTVVAPGVGAGEKAVPVNGGFKTISSGGVSLTLAVKQLVDPVKPVVDTAQSGNRLVGVIVTGSSTGKYEPSKTSAGVVLNTTDGKTTAVRIIADGTCAGSFFPGAVLGSAKKTTGCIGFELPKNAKPDSITVSLSTLGKGGEEATWKLPAAS